MKKCQSCGGSVRPSAKYCVLCGFNIRDFELNAEKKKMFCPECGVRFSALYSDAYCTDDEGNAIHIVCPDCAFDLTADALLGFSNEGDLPEEPPVEPPLGGIVTGGEVSGGGGAGAPAERITVSGKLTLGNYPQRAYGSAEPIVWRVLAKRDGAALLIAERAIERKEYHELCEDTLWEFCSLRRWLNGEFFSSAFSDEERELIIRSHLTNPNNARTFGGEDTDDCVFLLSITEAEAYFHTDEERCAKPTEHACSEGLEPSELNGNARWLLRSPGMSPEMVSSVDEEGMIDTVGCEVNEENSAVRKSVKQLRSFTLQICGTYSHCGKNT